MLLKQILIFTLLIIFVIGIVQTTYASNAISGTVVTHDFIPNGNLNSQATCSSLVDGTWDENTKTCTIPDNGRTLKIGDKQTLVIDSGYTLVVSNSGSVSTGIYLTTSISGGGQIINNGIIIISNSGERSRGIDIGKPSSIINNGIILITNSGRGSNGIFTADYVGCSYAIQTNTSSCATSLINNGDIIISNTNPPTSSKWDESNGIYGGKIIDRGTVRVMDKVDAYRELAERKAPDDKRDTENTTPQIICSQGTELIDGICQVIKTGNNPQVFDKPVKELEQKSISNIEDVFSRLIDMIRSLFNFS
jgi:hypothetical protein